MPKKRRNNGRNLMNKGKSISVHCNNCTRLVPKDKAVKRYIIKNMVDGSSKRDIEEASAYKNIDNEVNNPIFAHSVSISNGPSTQVVSSIFKCRRLWTTAVLVHSDC